VVNVDVNVNKEHTENGALIRMTFHWP